MQGTYRHGVREDDGDLAEHAARQHHQNEAQNNEPKGVCGNSGKKKKRKVRYMTNTQYYYEAQIYCSLVRMTLVRHKPDSNTNNKPLAHHRPKDKSKLTTITQKQCIPVELSTSIHPQETIAKRIALMILSRYMGILCTV